MNSVDLLDEVSISNSLNITEFGYHFLAAPIIEEVAALSGFIVELGSDLMIKLLKVGYWHVIFIIMKKFVHNLRKR